MMNKHIARTSHPARHRRPAFLRAQWQWLAVLLILPATSLPASQAHEGNHSLEAIRTLAEDFIRARLDADPASITVRADRLDPRLRLKECTGKTETYLPAGERSHGRMAVGVRCNLDAHRWSLFVPVTVTHYADIVVATRSLPRGVSVDASAVQLERRAISQLHGGYLLDTMAAIGQLTKNTVTKGAVISPRLLKQRNLVKRGQSVIILAKNAVIQVRSQGIALSDGTIGEVIRVRNRLTKIIVEGTITSDGLVEIHL